MKDFSKYSEKELAKLLTGSEQDSQLAFTEIYNRYSQRVYAYVCRILDNDRASKDVFQETFLKFYETYRNDIKDHKILNLLITIARNLCWNHFRSEKILTEYDEIQNPVIDFDLSDNELVEIIKEKLQLIDFESREIFILRLYENLSYEDISHIMGLKISSARTKFARAKKKLRKIMLPYLSEKNNY